MGRFGLKYSKKHFGDYKSSFEFQKLKLWVGENKNVLEIGCHTADLGYLLQKESNTVTGVDINHDAIEIAKAKISSARIIDLNCKDFIAQFKCSKFDVIICNQVLEHLLDPEMVIKNLQEILSPVGTIIIGLPNICNAKDRFDITFGKFEYTDIGVMDNTHLKFFNQNTARKLIEDAGLIIEDYYSPWQVNPIKHFLDHIPLMWRMSRLMDDKPPRFLKRRINLTDTVMLFKCYKA